MFRKLSVSAVALSLLAAPAMAANITYKDGDDTDGNANNADVVINIEVQQIAELEVTEQSATMTIDDGSDTFMGDASSSGTDFGNVAKLVLRSNFDVDSIDFTYPTTDNLFAFGVGGAATCVSPGGCNGSTVIGVQPQASPTPLTGPSVFFGDNNAGPVGPTGGLLRVTGTNKTNDEFGGLPAGETEIGIGVSTNWDRTKLDEQQFAGEGTYSITFSATVVPSI